MKAASAVVRPPDADDQLLEARISGYASSEFHRLNSRFNETCVLYLNAAWDRSDDPTQWRHELSRRYVDMSNAADALQARARQELNKE